MDIHKEFHGRLIRIPPPGPGLSQPFQGQIAVVTYGGWEDWYYVHVDGKYLCRARAAEIEPQLIQRRHMTVSETLRDRAGRSRK